MKRSLFMLAAVGLPLLAGAVSWPGKEPSVFTIDDMAASVSDVTIPWTVSPDTAWQAGPPLFELADPANPAFRVRGWMAATREELVLRVDVSDSLHTNSSSGARIRDGDFIRLALDGKGDGAGTGPLEAEGLFGDDDAAICFALTGRGPEGWTFDTTIPGCAGSYPAELLDVARDEAAKITRYAIRLPWKRLAVEPGVFPHFGLAIQVQNVDSRLQEATRLSWGARQNEAAATFFKANRPGLYKKIGWANPPHALAAAAPSVTSLFQAGEDARFVVALASRKDVLIRAESRGTNREFRINGAADSGIRRFVLGYRPAGDNPAESVTVSVSPDGGQTPAASVTAEVVVAEAVVQDCLARLDARMAGAGHPLFHRHLKSVKAMVQTEWARASVYKQENRALALETLKHVQAIAAGLGGRAASWESYVQDGLPLFMAYVSSRDGTLQWYALTLPKGWSPEKHRDGQAAYPMFFELHGRANPHYLFYPAAQLGAAPADPALVSFAMRQRNGYHVYPFGRGNSGYRDIGEMDVWEACEDVQETVLVDPDRRYLYGFSMGGAGAWSLGSRTPDRWAAIAITGAGVRVEPWGQAGNVSALPIYMWGGEADTLGYGNAVPALDQMTQFAKAVGQAGGSVTVRSTPGIGHNFRIKEQEELVNWLQQWTRKRPDEFSFTADTDLHRTAWGITVPRRSLPTELPRFTCKIEGDVVRVTARDCSHIDVQLGSNGLAMTGAVTLIVNGQERYRGEATFRRFDLQAD
jgi:predicted esterase